MVTNKLNIALIGYGKMGKIIEKVALKRGHTIGLKISSANLDDFNSENLAQIDAAIEFTTPVAAVHNLSKLAAHKVPTACGTTAWLDDYDEVCSSYQDNDTGFLYASNFSLGVNVFFAVNKQLAKLMNGLTDYNISITESHHITKLDAPSGTAVTIAEDIMENMPRKTSWALNKTGEDIIPINAIREKDVKGMHQLEYKSEIDAITIKHEAFSREGFALGAVLAAEYIAQKTGIHTMQDVLRDQLT